MNELQIRINSIIQIFASDLSKADKVVAACKVLSGMDITHFTNQKKQMIYKHITASNNIMSRYSSIKNYDDYKIMSDADLNKLLKSVQQLCLKLLID